MLTLKKRDEFRRVQRGRKWVAPAFVMYGMAREPLGSEQPRFGFTVSSKSLAETKESTKKRGRAVARNRARRRLKEAVRLSAPLAAQPRFDYVIVGRAEARSRNFAELLADMRLAFHKVSETAHVG